MFRQAFVRRARKSREKYLGWYYQAAIGEASWLNTWFFEIVSITENKYIQYSINIETYYYS